jgi:hypothetical protein
METGKPLNRPDQDETAYAVKPRVKEVGTGRPRGSTQPGVADADKRARTGSEKEDIRNTPPAGKWNDVGSNE